MHINMMSQILLISYIVRGKLSHVYIFVMTQAVSHMDICFINLSYGGGRVKVPPIFVGGKNRKSDKMRHCVDIFFFDGQF